MKSDSELSDPSGQSSQKKEHAVWNENETAALIEFFKQASKTAGSASFKAATFNAAALHIRPLYTSGSPPKTTKQIHLKWDQVRLVL